MNNIYIKMDLKNEKILTEWISKGFLSTEIEEYKVIKDAKTQNTGEECERWLFGENL